MEDPRFLLLSPDAFGPDPRKQLIACVEPLRLLPRGSTGIEIPKGVNTVHFDIPENVTLLTSVHNRVEVSGELEKCDDIRASPQVWEPVVAGDAKQLLLNPNFIAHAFSQINLQCGHRDTKSHGYCQHGLGLYSDFVLSHTKDTVKVANFTTSPNDPANFTPLTKTGWTYQPAAGGENEYTKAFAALITDNAFTVSYRPLMFPFWLGGKTTPEYGGPSYVIPPMNTQVSLAFEIDAPFSNAITHSLASPKAFRLKLTSMALHLVSARLTQLGEKAVKEKQGKSLAQYPGTTVIQHPQYVSGTGGVINLEGIECPTHVLIQAFDSGVLTSGPPTATVYVQPLETKLGEVVLKFDSREFYIARTNQCDVEDKNMAAWRRKEFAHFPFFDMEVDPKVAAGPIANYRHEHLLLSLLSNPQTLEKMQTINPSPPDAKRGKLTIELKAKRGSTLQPLYLVTLIYQGHGLVIDRANKTFISSVLTP